MYISLSANSILEENNVTCTYRRQQTPFPPGLWLDVQSKKTIIHNVMSKFIFFIIFVIKTGNCWICVVRYLTCTIISDGSCGTSCISLETTIARQHYSLLFVFYFFCKYYDSCSLQIWNSHWHGVFDFDRPYCNT